MTRHLRRNSCFAGARQRLLSLGFPVYWAERVIVFVKIDCNINICL